MAQRVMMQKSNLVGCHHDAGKKLKLPQVVMVAPAVGHTILCNSWFGFTCRTETGVRAKPPITPLFRCDDRSNATLTSASGRRAFLHAEVSVTNMHRLQAPLAANAMYRKHQFTAFSPMPLDNGSRRQHDQPFMRLWNLVVTGTGLARHDSPGLSIAHAQ